MSDYLNDLRRKIKGPVFSIVTPFKKDSSIDFDALNKYLEMIYRSGGRIFYLMAYNSRFSELSWSEIKVLSKFVVEKVKKIDINNIAIVADPLHCSTEVSIDFCKHAEKIGADIISLIFREKFYSEEQVYNHYLNCAKSTKIGILIHEMPFNSGINGEVINFPVTLLDKIADIDNVIAIKEDAKEDDYSNEVINCLKERLSIIISGGGKRQWLRFAEKGCNAWLNGIGVIEPQIPIIFYEAYKKGNMKLVDRIINEIEEPIFNNIIYKYGWHIGIKACLEAYNVFPRHERMPMLPIDNIEMDNVNHHMQEISKSIKNIIEISKKESN